MLYIGRILGGAAGGIVSVVAPSYVGKKKTLFFINHFLNSYF